MTLMAASTVLIIYDLKPLTAVAVGGGGEVQTSIKNIANCNYDFR